ncbi:sulfatase-like hydrolase/transferase [Opitutales bacterium]|nr:sulfatase-like hydrolase/transferase [Opitutales bacterium]
MRFTVFSFLSLCSFIWARDEQPNILYIFTDDQSVRSVSAYEKARSWVSTPNIDRLAKSGVRFTQCYTGTWCQPSRASALTGLLQHRLDSIKVTKYPMASYDPKKLPFFPSVLRKNGYETACIGKWHLGEDVGHGRDWDYSVIWDRGGGRRNAMAYYQGTQVRTNGGPREALGGYSNDRFTEIAEEYILKQAAISKPWFLWLCYPGVHGPYTPADRHMKDYSGVPDAKVPVDIFGPRPTKPEHLKDLTRWKKDSNGDPLKYDNLVKKYHRAVRSLDDGVGTMLAALKKTGQLENTVIIFTSDQGFAWGQHGLQEKWAAYDANLLAPLIFSSPGKIQANTICKEPVNGVDITRTIHSLSRTLPAWQMHGRDLSGLLDAPSSSLTAPMLLINTTYEYGNTVTERLKSKNYDIFQRRGLTAWLMMRDGPYKYIRHFDEDTIEELYDLNKDPEELNNLAVSSQHHDLLKKLRVRTVEEMQKKDGDFVQYLPAPKERHY